VHVDALGQHIGRKLVVGCVHHGKQLVRGTSCGLLGCQQVVNHVVGVGNAFHSLMLASFTNSL
jgi:hypothetical protein